MAVQTETQAIAFSSRVRLARNLADTPFPNRLSERDAAQVTARIADVMKSIPDPAVWRCLPLQSIEPVQRLALVERHLVSAEMTSAKHDATLWIRDDETLSILVNEEDHLRIQAIRPGLDLERAYDDARRLATWLETKLRLATHPRYGYLTSCPTNVGTGLRASVMLHLPALRRRDMIGTLFQTLSRSGFTLRGFSGEGSEGQGDLFQVSNQVTLGRTGRAILNDLLDIAAQVMASETRARAADVAANRDGYADQVARAYAVLRHAVLIDWDEAMRLLSRVREGVERGFRTTPSIATLNALQLSIGPATVAWRQGAERGRSDAAARAALIQETLAAEDVTQRGETDVKTAGGMRASDASTPHTPDTKTHSSKHEGEIT